MVYCSYFGDDCCAWSWEDPILPETGLVIDDRGEIVYWYLGSVEPQGPPDTSAVRRALRAWKAQEAEVAPQFPEGVWMNPRVGVAPFAKRVLPHIPQHPPWLKSSSSEEEELSDEELAELLFG